MGKNELAPGRPRLGWLVDGDASTPHVAVMLENVENQIRLTIPTWGIGDRTQYSRWFGFNAQYGDDPERTRFAYRPPGVLEVADSDGSVVLVGCRAASAVGSFRVGQGRIVADYAVLGGEHLSYDRINGVRTEMPILPQWAALASVELEYEFAEGPRTEEVALKLRALAEVPLDRALNLRLRPSWRIQQSESEGTYTVRDVVQVATSAVKPRSWDDHLDLHRALRDLVSLSAWERFGFSRIWVTRIDDPERSLAGALPGDRWMEVVTRRLRPHEPATKTPRFLWVFDDIEAKGVRTWLRVRRHFERAVQPLLGVLDQRVGQLETQLVQTGIALESLAYQLEVDGDGSGLNGRGQLRSFLGGLRRIVDDMDFAPFDDMEDWQRRATECHRALKHADNPTPDALTLAATYSDNLVVLRCWLAVRLGVDKELLRQRLTLDPVARAYRPVPRD